MTTVLRGDDNFDTATRAGPQLMTAQASTSGTSIDFTDIPSWVKKITVMFYGVSTSGTSNIQLVLGTASGLESAGYTSTSGYPSVTGSSTSGMLVVNLVSAANSFSGEVVVAKLMNNVWVQSGVVAADGVRVYSSSGYKSLAGVLTQLSATTINGTDTFDAGTINVMYE